MSRSKTIEGSIETDGRSLWTLLADLPHEHQRRLVCLHVGTRPCGTLVRRKVGVSHQLVALNTHTGPAGAPLNANAQATITEHECRINIDCRASVRVLLARGKRSVRTH